MRKTYLSAVIAETKGQKIFSFKMIQILKQYHANEHEFNFDLSFLSGSRGGSLLTPIYRRLKWFVTLLRHIVQLIVRSFANIDKEEKNNDVGRKLPDITEADDDILEIEGPGVVAIERENVQRIVKAEPRLTPSYVPNHERKEADKSYAERKLQEIENLQV